MTRLPGPSRALPGALALLHVLAVAGCDCSARGPAGDAETGVPPPPDGAPGGDAAAPADAAPGIDAAPGTDAVPGTDAGPNLVPCGPPGNDGTQLFCDADTAVCVIYGEGTDPAAPPPTCAPEPPGCQDDHTCACIGQWSAICTSSYWNCLDTRSPNTINCVWTKI